MQARRACTRASLPIAHCILAALVLVASCTAPASEAPVRATDGEATSGTVARAPAADPEDGRVLRVCADPNNLPFSNEAGEGLENRLAELVAEEMGARVEYTWWAQRRGFVRNTLRARLCDVMMGAPTSYELVLTTRPYYRSTYVFVQRADAPLIRSLDDPALRDLRIGVHMIGDDYSNTPAAHALARRGMVGNVVGFSIYGDYARPDPPARILDALAAGEVDVAVVWGPLAGYFAPRLSVPVRLTPVEPQVDVPFLPFVFDVSMGVRRDDPALRQELDAILLKRRDDVARILAEYRVPLVTLRGARQSR